MIVNVNQLSYQLHGIPIVQHIDLRIETGQFVGLIGPNGSGKSTVLKHIYRVLEPQTGVIMMDEKPLSQLTYKETAQNMAVVSQEGNMTFDFKVRDIVMMGRHPHKRFFEADHAGDQALVDQALTRVGISQYAERNFATLSGGEKQRVYVARALAQQAKLLILDEPTNHLDIRYQLQIMDLVKTIGITVLAAMHDLNIASLYCDRIYVIKSGKIIAVGTPEEILHPQLLWDVFGVIAEVHIHPVTQKPHITFLSEMLHSTTK